jgi:MerR family transcriptional regulator, redox-sensitive transcriptional activator SoxR
MRSPTGRAAGAGPGASRDKLSTCARLLSPNRARLPDLISSRRTKGNQRRYQRDALRRVALIRVAQRVGIPLARIRAALAELPTAAPPSRSNWQRLSLHWQAELDQRIHRLQQLRDQFTDSIGCGCLSIDQCVLANPHDALGQHGPGPRRLLTSEHSSPDLPTSPRHT